MGRGRSGHRFSRKCARLGVLVLFVFTVSLAGEAFSGEDRAEAVGQDRIREPELNRAFQIGLGRNSDERREAKILISRYGRTLLMTGTLTGSDVKEDLVCVLCNSEEALTGARGLGAALAARNGSPEPALVSAGSEADGGDVFVDGLPLAPAGAVSKIEPGIHHVSIRRKGGVFEGHVEMKSGQKIALSSDVLSRRYDRARRLRAAALVGGLGLSAIATGTLFMWLDGNCATTKEDPSTGKCVEEHELTAPGLSLIIGGALTETLLIWLLWPESDVSGGV